jgi:2,3-bisphosphoglycerate-dependent phosphoglycerate mutase
VATTIVLVRHGETDWNRERRFQGHADVPLNELGRRQARELAATLADDSFDAAYASPLRRALETAEIVAADLGMPVEAHEGLVEVDVGSWSGLTTAEAEQRFPDGFRRWRETRAGGWTDGETYDELGARVTAALRGIAARHPGGRVLAVTHGGPIRSVRAAAAGLSFEAGRTVIGFVENCEVVTIAIRDGVVEEVD